MEPASAAGRAGSLAGRLALASGIDRAYVGRVERGSENVTITTLEAFASALTVPIATLLIEPDQTPRAASHVKGWSQGEGLD